LPSAASKRGRAAHESAKPLNDWSEEEVEKWLEVIDPKIAKAAKAAGVNGRVLQELDAPAWTELGVTVALRRCQLAAEVKLAAEGKVVATHSRKPSITSKLHLTLEEEEKQKKLMRLEAKKKEHDAVIKDVELLDAERKAVEAAKKADKEAAETAEAAEAKKKEAKKKKEKEAAETEAKKTPAVKKAERKAAEIAADIADLKRHRIQIRCAIQNLNTHDFAKSQTFEAYIKFEASWEDRSPILYEMLAAGYKLGDRIVKEKEKCTYNKFVILQHDGSEYSELFTPRITFMNRAREPKTKEEQCVAELPSCLKWTLIPTDSLPDDQ